MAIMNTDGNSLISLDNEVRATKMLKYVMENPKSEDIKAELNAIFKTDDFYLFVE